MLFFKKKPEKKSYDWRDLSFFNILCNDYKSTNNAKQFIDFFIDSCPVFTGTTLIADAISSIEIVLKDKKTGDFTYNHEALKLLNNPNPFTDGQLFLKELASFYLLTGNNYLNIIGETKPIEINNIIPQAIKFFYRFYKRP